MVDHGLPLQTVTTLDMRVKTMVSHLSISPHSEMSLQALLQWPGRITSKEVNSVGVFSEVPMQDTDLCSVLLFQEKDSCLCFLLFILFGDTNSLMWWKIFLISPSSETGFKILRILSSSWKEKKIGRTVVNSSGWIFFWCSVFRKNQLKILQQILREKEISYWILQISYWRSWERVGW